MYACTIYRGPLLFIYRSDKMLPELTNYSQLFFLLGAGIYVWLLAIYKIVHAYSVLRTLYSKRRRQSKIKDPFRR